MLPFTRPSIEELVAKEIVLTNFGSWTNKGTIWTPNNIDYNFIYRILEDVIGDITIFKNDIRFLRGNMFYFKPGSKAGRLINKYDAKGARNSEYVDRSNVIDYSMLYVD